MSNKLKFHLDLTLKDLTNIPQISGSCVVDITIYHLMKPILGLNMLKSHLSATTEKVSSPDKASKDDSEKSNSNGSLFTSTSNHIHVKTSRVKVKSFRCSFNVNVQCNLKFPLRSKDRTVRDKMMKILVYFYPELSSSSGTLLGKVDLNLSEYLNFDSEVSSKYLLMDSKVNSILNLSINLDELPNTEEFHTSLQVLDAPESKQTLLRDVKTGQSSHFPAPHFDKHNVFGGIHEVIDKESGASKDINNGSDSDLDSRRSQSVHNDTKENFICQGLSQPLVSSLYRKVLESRWEPELCNILSYTPEKCVSDIFDTIDLQKTKKTVGVRNTDNDEEDEEELRDINGLLDEKGLRNDLRSWTISNQPITTAKQS